MMDVSIIIPNYNGAKLLRKNLPKVLEMTKDCEVILVDDASTDESVKEVKSTEQRGKIKLIENEKNLGFSSTVNRGVKEAKGDFVFLLNSDAVPEKDFLTPLLSHFKDPKIFAVGCLQKSSQWKGKKGHGRSVGKFEKGFLVHGPGSMDKKNTLWVFGGAGIFRKSIWQTLGGMDILYNPFYWEDIDLSYRALKAGFKLVFEPESVVVHRQEKGAIRSMYSQENIKAIAYRNQILFVWLNITDAFFIFQHFLYLPYHFLKALVSFDKEFIRGLFMAVKKLPRVIRHRWRNKRLSKISDREVLRR